MDDSPTRPVRQPQAAPPGWYPADGGVLRYWNGWQWTAHEQPMPPAHAWPADHGNLGYRMAQIEIVSDRRVSTVEVALAWVFTILTLGYLLPWAVAATRGKSNSLAIGLVNFFLGWTFIGWLVALVMACQSHQVAGYR